MGEGYQKALGPGALWLCKSEANPSMHQCRGNGNGAGAGEGRKGWVAGGPGSLTSS